MESYDFAVIGGGSAGYAAAATASRLGLKTVVVEGGRDVGGLCILRGCMPSKALLSSAHRAALVREAGEFGIHARLEGIDGVQIQSRKRALVEDFASYRRGQLESGRFTFLRGKARFKNDRELEVFSPDAHARSLTAKTFLIATGSHIEPAPIQGLKETGYLDSDAWLECDEVPQSIIVLGGGAIALEAATFYSNLGCKVTILQRSSRLLKESDPDVSAAVENGLQKRGVVVRTGVQILSIQRSGALKTVYFEQQNQRHQVDAEEILYALGRSPSTEPLGITGIGIALSNGRVFTHSTQQSSIPHIFAAGDVCGPLEVVHIAIQQGEIAARNAHRLLNSPDAELESIDYRLKLSAVFSEPSVATVGMSESEAAQKDIPFLSASYPFSDHGRSMVDGHLDGFVKLIVHARSREILGGAVVGPQAAELIQEIVVAMAFRSTAGSLSRIPHYHPTLSEIWTYPAEDLSEPA